MRTFEISISAGDLACSMKVDAPNRDKASAEAMAAKAARLCAMLWGVDRVNTTLAVVDTERKVESYGDVPWCEGRR